jgi:geranylgeranyl pyrophosphate synthase
LTSFPAEADALSFLGRARELTDLALTGALDEVLPCAARNGPVAGARGAQPDLAEVVRYAVMGGGKRLRPALMIAAYGSAGGREPAISDLAAAVEIVHAYSLVHDDLPAMDDDDIRRGRPTVHRIYGVRTATLAGCAMVPIALRVARRGIARLSLGPDPAREIMLLMFRAAGAGGLIGGQALDLDAAAGAHRLSPEALETIERAKTGALIAASVEIGALAAGADAAARAAYRGYGEEVGFAFQMIDDVLDETATSAELGKTAGKDRARGKPTFAALLGIEGSYREAARLAERAVARLEAGGVSSPLLAALARFVVARRC